MPPIRNVSISEIDELKLIYYEIVDGYSFDAELKFYIKHFNEKDTALLLRKREELFHYYSKEGVPHESELLKNAIENEEWSNEKEERILELKYHISDNERHLHNILPEQRGAIVQFLEENRNKLADMLFERKHTLGRNIEDLIDDDVNDYVIYLSFFKDQALTQTLADTYADFQNWDTTEIGNLNKHLGMNYRKFSEEKIKGIAALPFFLNKLSYSKENIQTFLGKPVMDLTHNQNFLFSFGLRNLNIHSVAKGNPPDLNLDAKVADVVKWYDFQSSLNIGKKNES